MARLRTSSVDVTPLFNDASQRQDQADDAEASETDSTGHGPFPIPVIDPFGFVEKLTRGRCQDLFRAYIRSVKRENW